MNEGTVGRKLHRVSSQVAVEKAEAKWVYNMFLSCCLSEVFLFTATISL